MKNYSGYPMDDTSGQKWIHLTTYTGSMIRLVNDVIAIIISLLVSEVCLSNYFLGFKVAIRGFSDRGH